MPFFCRSPANPFDHLMMVIMRMKLQMNMMIMWMMVRMGIIMKEKKMSMKIPYVESVVKTMAPMNSGFAVTFVRDGSMANV